MLWSVILNLAMTVTAVSAVICHCKNAPVKTVLRFFTVLSNLFCAAASFSVAFMRISGSVPDAILAVKFVGTAAVTVTLLTVMLFLGPVVYNFKILLQGPDFWLHLICPLLAIVTLLFWDRPGKSFGTVFLGTLPVIVYGAFYLYHIRFAPEKQRWEDFYGFDRSGKWWISYLLMIGAAFLISLVLWAASQIL